MIQELSRLVRYTWLKIQVPLNLLESPGVPQSVQVSPRLCEGGSDLSELEHDGAGQLSDGPPIMKAALTVLLVLSPCPSLGYSSLLSLLAGDTAKPLPDQQRDEHLYETRVAKNADIGEEEKTASLLDTLNLSYAGNLDISNAVGQVSASHDLDVVPRYQLPGIR